MEVDDILPTLTKLKFKPSHHASKTDIIWDQRYHVFRFKSKPFIWTYWNNFTKIPDIIKLSLSTIYFHNSLDFHIEVVNSTTIHKWIPDVHKAFELLSPVHQADYFRARILHAYGGIYADSDCISFCSLSKLFEKLRTVDLVGTTFPPEGVIVSVGAIGPIRANQSLTSLWVKRLNGKLDALYPKLIMASLTQLNYPIGWGEILREIFVFLVEDMVANGSLEYFSLDGLQTFSQLTTSGIRQDLHIRNLSKPFVIRKTPLLYYHHSASVDVLDVMSLNELLKSNLLVVVLHVLSFSASESGNYVVEPSNLFVYANGEKANIVSFVGKTAESLLK